MHSRSKRSTHILAVASVISATTAAMLTATPASAAIPNVTSEYWGTCPALSGTTSSGSPYSVSPGPATSNWPVPVLTTGAWTGAGATVTSVQADATTLSLGGYERAAHEPGTAQTRCELQAHLTNTLTVNPGSSGKQVGDPVVVVLTTQLSGGLDGWGDTSAAYSTSAGASVKLTVKDDAFATLASYTADGYGDVNGSGGNVASANLDGKYDVYLYGNHSGSHSETPTEQQWSAGVTATPYAASPAVDLTTSVGTRTMTFDTKVGAVLNLDGALRTDEDAYGGASAAIADISSFTASFAADPANPGLVLTLGSDTTDVPTYTSVVNPTVFFGDPFSLEADVTSDSGTPGGSVSYVIDGAPAGSATLSSTGRALLPLNTSSPYLSVGQHLVSGSYAGSPGYLPSTSVNSLVTVLKATTATDLVVSPIPTTPSQPVRLVATVVDVHGAGAPTGSVTFRDGSTVLGSYAVGSGGVAAMEVPGKNLVGYHVLTATYNGDGTHSTSSAQRTIPRKK